jgi:hypothetical protein
LFAARRPGTDWIARSQRGPLRGCGAVVAGALGAQTLLTLPLATLLPLALGAPTRADALVALPAPADGMLGASSPRLRFPAYGFAAREVRLRPLAAPPAGPLQPSRVRVLLDGSLLPAEPAFDASGQLARLGFQPRAVGTLEVEFAGGTVPLLFAPGSVVLVGAAQYWNGWNGVLAALAYLAPTFAALAFGCLCGAGAGLATVLAVVASLLFVQTLGGAGPADEALRAVQRGHWIPAELRFSSWFPSIAAGSAAMILAMMLRRRPRR